MSLVIRTGLVARPVGSGARLLRARFLEDSPHVSFSYQFSLSDGWRLYSDKACKHPASLADPAFREGGVGYITRSPTGAVYRLHWRGE